MAFIRPLKREKNIKRLKKVPSKTGDSGESQS
jgi:hypothetical protein